MVSPGSNLPDPALVAQVCVGILGIIVIWDAWWLTKARKDIPHLGELPNHGFAWETEGSHEVSRQWANLLTLAAMMALPWMLAQMSDTPMIWVYVWDGLLALHLISLLIPKRYAITSTHMFADGQRFEWERLRLPQKQPKRRLILLRKGWGPFAPLPLGGSYSNLAIAHRRIQSILGQEE